MYMDVIEGARPLILLQEAYAEQPDVESVLGEFEQSFSRDSTTDEYLKMLFELADLVQLDESVTYFPAEAVGRTRAFAAGELLAYKVIHECLPTQVQAKMFKIGHDVANPDPLERLRQIRDLILAEGEVGLSVTPKELAALIESWAPEITSVPSHQSLVSSGFGEVMYLAHEAIELVGKELIELDVLDKNWEAALENLLADE
jgi:hypothetical protein